MAFYSINKRLRGERTVYSTSVKQKNKGKIVFYKSKTFTSLQWEDLNISASIILSQPRGSDFIFQVNPRSVTSGLKLATSKLIPFVLATVKTERTWYMWTNSVLCLRKKTVNSY